jgi:hypothetical protein
MINSLIAWLTGTNTRKPKRRNFYRRLLALERKQPEHPLLAKNKSTVFLKTGNLFHRVTITDNRKEFQRKYYALIKSK